MPWLVALNVLVIYFALAGTPDQTSADPLGADSCATSNWTQGCPSSDVKRQEQEELQQAIKALKD